MTTQGIDARLKQLKDLPTLPAVLVQCNKLLKDPNVSTANLAKVIQSDQAISAKVLKLVNSSFYGLSGKVSGISQAIVVLGFSTVRNIILSLSVFDLFPKDTDLGGFEIAKFWKHSIGCAVITRLFSKRLGVKDIEEAFIAGLLHDIGKLVIAKMFRDDFITILKTTHKEKVLILDAEKEILGMDHTQIGGALAKVWKLPTPLLETIAFHHNGTKELNAAKLVYITHLADIITRGLQIGSGGDRVIPEINPTAWEKLNMSSDTVEKWIVDLDEEFDKASAFFSVLSL